METSDTGRVTGGLVFTFSTPWGNIQAENIEEYDLFLRTTSLRIQSLWLDASDGEEPEVDTVDVQEVKEQEVKSDLDLEAIVPILVKPAPNSFKAVLVETVESSSVPKVQPKPPSPPPPILEIHGKEYRSYRDLVKKDDSILHDLPPEDQRTFICVFCKGNNEPEAVYTSHPIRIDGVVSCPYLRVHVCQLCKATGNEAHTIKYCLKNRRGFFATKAREKDQLDENENYVVEADSNDLEANEDQSKVKKRVKRRGKNSGKGQAHRPSEESDEDFAARHRSFTSRRQKRGRTRHRTPPRFKNSKRS